MKEHKDKKRKRKRKGPVFCAITAGSVISSKNSFPRKNSIMRTGQGRKIKKNTEEIKKIRMNNQKKHTVCG